MPEIAAMEPVMAEKRENISVLFVCMGNICRSPTAEGVLRKLVSDAGLDARIRVDSAGTHAFHRGEPPDRRAAAAAERRGVSLAGIKARRIAGTDFEQFDFILAMDQQNLDSLKETSESAHHEKVHLFLEYAGKSSVNEVPDPYYGGSQGFERVLDLIEDASKALLDQLRRTM